MLAGIGIKDTNTQLILNIIYALVGWVFSAMGSRLHDVIGRRKMLIGATVGMIISLTIVAACSAGFVVYGNTTAPTVSIVFIFVFGAVFAAGYTPMQPIYPAEVVSNKMRAKCMGTFKLTAGAAGFLNTFVGPTALANVGPKSLACRVHTLTDFLQIGYWFYVFFVFWDTFEASFMYFFFVETKGLTLEELDAVFEAKNPRKESLIIKKRLKEVANSNRESSSLKRRLMRPFAKDSGNAESA
jgi:MFS family permease